MSQHHTIRVECRGPKPPASSVAAAVWGNSGRVIGAQEATWDSLLLVSAKTASERVEITPVSVVPLVLEVSSSDHKLAHAAAFFLAMETHGRFV